MRRLALLLLPLATSLGVACTSINPDSGYPGLHGAGSGEASEDSGAPASEPSGGGSTPSPLRHSDAGSWQEPDAQLPSQGNPGIDSGGSGATADDSGTLAADTGTSNGDDSGSSNDALLASCVSSVNAFRTQNGLTAYTRSSALETFAAQAAASDAQSGQIDGYFDGNGGNGTSSAEDELVGDQIDQGATAAQVLDQGLLDEENGYLDGYGNLLSQQYSEVGCGVAQASDGSAWITIEYR